MNVTVPVPCAVAYMYALRDAALAVAVANSDIPTISLLLGKTPATLTVCEPLDHPAAVSVTLIPAAIVVPVVLVVGTFTGIAVPYAAGVVALPGMPEPNDTSAKLSVYVAALLQITLQYFSVPIAPPASVRYIARPIVPVLPVGMAERLICLLAAVTWADAFEGAKP